MLRLRYASIFAVMAAFACGSDSDPTPPNIPPTSVGGGGGAPQLPDEDGDGISDVDEGRAEGRDTDGDGIPDYQDADSDGDGIDDADEAGDDDTNTPPIDSDGDGAPDYVDLDADGNGIPDADEGTGDADGDGIGDFADTDNDGDGINDQIEIGGDPSSPLDSDGDGTADYLDIDSDNDTISDADEGNIDPDTDGIPSYLDLDSDGDCIADAAEAGDSDVSTPPADNDNDGQPNFHDRDSDNDGLSDTSEDDNCNGVLDPGETSSDSDDTDMDGVSDLIEDAAGTDPQDPNDNPQQNGDFVFVVPYEEPPSPTDDDLDFQTNLQQVDVYILVDRSGSMTSEIASIKGNIQQVANNVTCPPNGNGDPNDCIPDIWWGAGTVGYRGTGGQPYTNHLDLQPDASLVNGAIPTAEPSGCCAEPLLSSTWSTITGDTAQAAGCSVNSPYPSRLDCTGSPAGAMGIGYPCFRPGSLPIIMLTTDEPPTSTYNCPTIANVAAAANAVSAKIVGVRGSTTSAQVTTDLAALATQTGAVDALNGNAPLVVNGADANAATAIENAIRTLANGVPLDLNATPVDDPNDSVDAVAEFVDRLETLQLGTAECTDGLTDQDSNGDTYPDLYLGVTAGTPVCWRVVAKQNTTVQPTDEPQLFTATVEVYGNNITLLDTRDVYFLVPPDIEDVVIPR